MSRPLSYDAFARVVRSRRSHGRRPSPEGPHQTQLHAPELWIALGAIR